MLSSAAAKLRTSASTEVMLVTGWNSAGSDWVSFAVAGFFFLTANHRSERVHLCSPSNFRETLCWSRPSPTRALKTAALADRLHWERENRIFFTLCNQLQILQHFLSQLHKWGILMKGGTCPEGILSLFYCRCTVMEHWGTKAERNTHPGYCHHLRRITCVAAVFFSLNIN